VLLKLPEPNGLDGEVIHVDTFGNLITNIPARALPQRFEVRLREGRVVSGSHYAAVGRGELIALVGSAGLLELSARDASAAELTGATRGTRVSVQPV
jgi:S-adenosyl-L-methionine hydrolase (adenosine-forming)